MYSCAFPGFRVQVMCMAQAEDMQVRYTQAGCMQAGYMVKRFSGH